MLIQRWHIEMLGGLRASLGQQTIARFKSQKAAHLLAYLAFYVGSPHSREELQTLLWPDDELEAVQNRLRVNLNSLRHQLEPPGTPAGAVLVADRISVSLNPAAFTTDTAQFEAALDRALRAEEETARIQGLITVINGYGGSLLPGFYDEWIVSERERLAQSYLQALRRLTHCLAQSHDYERALSYALRVTQHDPLREEAHRDVIRLYVALGQPSSALQQYEELKRLLHAALGAMPAASTQQLARQIAEGLGHSVAPHSHPSESSPVVLLPSGSVASLTNDGKDVTKNITSDSANNIKTIDAETEGRGERWGGSLPTYLTRFFGRTHELEAVCTLLAPAVNSVPDSQDALHASVSLKTPEHQNTQLPEYIDTRTPAFPLFKDTPEAARLVTLTGMGGNGKTRLAIAVAQRLRSLFTGNVWFVPLSDLVDARLIGDAILSVLNLPRKPHDDLLTQLSEALANQPSLLILDNFEHLAEEGGIFVATLLAYAPLLSCLVTSRRSLGLPGEREFAIAPLPTPIDGSWLMVDGKNTPAPGLHPTPDVHLGPNRPLMDKSPTPINHQLLLYPSVQLFLDRAQAARPDFQITQRNAAEVAALCRELEGIPLALELAAARARVLTPAQMRHHLHQRFDLLVNQRAGKDERHRSLWATIEWSYRLLPSPLRRLFTRLSIFAGGWSLEAAQAVAAEVQGEILLLSPSDMLDDLERLRTDSLIVAQEVGNEIRFRMLETLREFAGEHLTPDERDTLGARYVHYFVALAEEARPHLKGAQQAFWLDRLQLEHDNLRAAFEWCSNDPNGAEMGLRLTRALERFWLGRGRVSEGRERSMQALAHPGAQLPTDLRANALIAAGALHANQDDYAGARKLHEQALAMARSAGYRSGEAWALDNLGTLEIREGDYAAARDLFEQSLAMHHATNDKAGIAATVSHLGLAAQIQEEYLAAQSFYEQSLALHRELGDWLQIAATLGNLGMIADQQGEYETARTFHEQSLTLHRDLNNQSGIAATLLNLGILASKSGEWETASTHFTECLALARELGLQRGIALALDNLGSLEELRGNAGAACSLHEQSLAIQRKIGDRTGAMRTLANLGRVHVSLGAQEQAHACLKECLITSRDSNQRWGMVEALEGCAALADAQHQTERAIRLYSAAGALRERIPLPLEPVRREERERTYARLRQAVSDAVFASAWSAGHVAPLEEVIAQALTDAAPPPTAVSPKRQLTST